MNQASRTHVIPATKTIEEGDAEEPHIRNYRLSPSLVGLLVLSQLPVASAQVSTALVAADATHTAESHHHHHGGAFIPEVVLIPVLVICSGILAGLTIGYMSLDMTTLAVLEKTGTTKQQSYAKAIMPIRKDGHLLLVTLLLANMIINETLPVIADSVLGGGIQAVVISTALIVIFSEIIPQSLCTRFGLQIGAFMVWPVKILIFIFFVVSWPVAKLLTWLIGAHSGMIYRRSELKELVAMHQLSDSGDGHGGDLQRDTVQIVAGALDFQVKSVGDAMTPIETAFMLNYHTTRLDYETLGKILESGHSRIPVYEEVSTDDASGEKQRVSRKIIGVILTKQFILLDPEDAVPLKELPVHPVPTVCENLPLHSMLNTFQEGRSHIAVVAPLKPEYRKQIQAEADNANSEPTTPTKEHHWKHLFRHRSRSSSDASQGDANDQALKAAEEGNNQSVVAATPTEPVVDMTKPLPINVLSSMADADHPCGIITLEDVLEELIGEEILDETDVSPAGARSLAPYLPKEYHEQLEKSRLATEAERSTITAPRLAGIGQSVTAPSTPVSEAKPGFLEDAAEPFRLKNPLASVANAASYLLPRSRSQPPRSRAKSMDVDSSGNVGTESPGAIPQSVALTPEDSEKPTMLHATGTTYTASTDATLSDATNVEGLDSNSNATTLQLPIAQYDRGRRTAMLLSAAVNTSAGPTPPRDLTPPLHPNLGPSNARAKVFKTMASPPSVTSSLRRTAAGREVESTPRESISDVPDHGDIEPGKQVD